MRRPLMLALSVLAVAVPVFFIGSSAAYAAGPCTTSSLSSQGYSLTQIAWPYANNGTLRTTDARLEFWRRSDGTVVIRGANLVADGKTGVVMKGGTTSGGAELGQSGSIGTAPSGGFCANPHYGRNYGYLGFYIGSRYYATGDTPAIP